jgi:serine protease Do
MPMLSRRLPLLFSAISLSGLLQGCVSYEPAVLVPALTLSPEDVSLVSDRMTTAGALEFGLAVTTNESDSLANVEILPGIRIRTVNPNGPADAAGLQPGDIILAVNGLETNHPDALTALQQQAANDAPFLFKVRRNTVVFEATVQPRVVTGNTPPQELYRADPVATRAGYRTELVRLRNAEPVAAARVIEIFDDSPLPAAGIKVGDLILAVDDRPINSAQGLITRLNQEYALGDRVAFTLANDTAVAVTTVTLWDPGRRISRIALGPLLQYSASLNPSSNSLSILDLWLFSFYSYQRTDGEKTHSLLGLFKFSSNYGELTETDN